MHSRVETTMFKGLRWLKEPKWYGQPKVDSGTLTIQEGSFEFEGRKTRLSSRHLTWAVLDDAANDPKASRTDMHRRIKVEGTLLVAPKRKGDAGSTIASAWFGFALQPFDRRTDQLSHSLCVAFRLFTDAEVQLLFRDHNQASGFANSVTDVSPDIAGRIRHRPEGQVVIHPLDTGRYGVAFGGSFTADELRRLVSLSQRFHSQEGSTWGVEDEKVIGWAFGTQS